MEIGASIAVPRFRRPRGIGFRAVAALRAALSACALLLAVLAVQLVAPVNDAAAQVSAEVAAGSSPGSRVSTNADGVIEVSHTRRLAFFVDTLGTPMPGINALNFYGSNLFLSGLSNPICRNIALRRFNLAGGAGHYYRGNCIASGLPAGAQTVRLEYPMGGTTVTLAQRLRLLIGADRQNECENPTGASRINPIGGTWDAASSSCLFPTERFDSIPDATKPPSCNSYANCDGYYRALRVNACAAPEKKYKSGYSTVYIQGEHDNADLTCVCTNTGYAPVGGACKSFAERALDEFAKSPDPAAVVDLLSDGLNPSATVSGGTPLLVVAATLGHADIVSVLITAGADASVKMGNSGNDFVPEYFSHNGLGLAGPTTTILPWRDAADIVIHFGDAVKVFNLTSTMVAYDWTKHGNFWPLTHLIHRYNNYSSLRNNAENAYAARVLGGYLVDQGSHCPNTSHDVCSSRRTCGSGKAYSCSVCAGFPYLDFDGQTCVTEAQCGALATVDTTTWPDSQCKCESGEANPAGKCPSLLDTVLVAEVEKPEPVLASVHALLNAGADPDAGGTGGLPLLFAAGRLGHADIVSVLVTFGVNASVNFDNRSFPEYMSENGLPGGADAMTGRGVLPWRDAAEVVIHFGEALKVFALTSATGAAYDWNVSGGDNWPLDYLRHRYDKFDSVRSDPATVAAVKAMAGYMLDQGSPCQAGAWGVNHVLCTSRPTCTSTEGVLYSCSECGGYPHLSADGAACVADGACRSDATLNTAIWPDSQCECDNGKINPAGKCPASLDAMLIAEVKNPNAVLSSVRALLNEGADPAAVGEGEIPLLFAAGRLGHADIVSVLVTFGVNTTVVFQTTTFPEYMAANGFDFNTGRTTISWRDAAEVVIHFGEALKVFTLTSAAGTTSYDWANTKGHNWPAEHLRSRYDSAALVNNNPEARAAMEVMAGYMLDQGSVCPAQWAAHAVCASRPECPATGGPLYSCSECGGYPNRTLDGASCVAQCRRPTRL